MKLFSKNEILFFAFLGYAVVSCEALKYFGIWESYPLVALVVLLSAILCLAWDLRYLVNRWINRKV